MADQSLSMLSSIARIGRTAIASAALDPLALGRCAADDADEHPASPAAATLEHGRPAKLAATPNNSVHGGNIWLLFDDTCADPAPSLESLPDEIVRHIGHVSIAAAVGLAQCSQSLHQTLRDQLRWLVRVCEARTLEVSLEHTAWAPARPGRSLINTSWWLKQALELDGRLVVLADGPKSSTVMSCDPPPEGGDPAGPFSVVWATDGRWGNCFRVASIRTPTAVAAHGSTLLVCNGVAGTLQNLDAAGRRLNTLAEAMQGPCAMAADAEHAFVCSGGQVRRFDLALVAMGHPDACTATWPVATPEGGCEACEHGMALLGGELFLVDQRASRVHAFCADTGAHRRSFGRRGAGPGELCQPWGAAACGDHLLISERGGRRVQVFTPQGRPVGMLAPPGCGALAHVWVAPPSPCSRAAAGEGGREGGDGDGARRVLVADWDGHCVREMLVRPWY